METSGTTVRAGKSSEAVLEYWFGAASATDRTALGAKIGRWFGSQQVASEIRERYACAVEAAVCGGLRHWDETPRGRLALIIVLDQFTRYLYGMDARAYGGDAQAVELALRLADDGSVLTMATEQRQFALMPLAHAEDLQLQKRGLLEAEKMVAGAPENLRQVFEVAIGQSNKFIAVIERFGRFPHRNQALGRESTAEEIEFLKTWPARHAPADLAARLS